MNYKAGIYIRLSKEDNEKYQQSESIINQRQLLYDYLSKNGYELIEEYIDDGYTGTNFDRPGFNKMIKDIENGLINMVVTKDLSRLGRDYIQSGHYVENYFPEKKIRYVSLLDGIDTAIDGVNNDIAPFKALFNDMVSKDTSKKIKAILQNKKQQGLFLGNSAPYGYLKDPTNKYHLIIDPIASEIVKKIFQLKLDGKTNYEIVEFLNKNKYQAPSLYKNSEKKSTNWSSSSVYNILTNREYTGCLVSNVWTKISYKNKKRIKQPMDKWIISLNTHEPIISEITFNTVNKKVNGFGLMLADMIYCSECGSLLRINYIKKRNHYIVFCKRYKKKLCTSHYYNYQKLEELVLKQIHSDKKIIINRDNLVSLVEKIYVFEDKSIEICYQQLVTPGVKINSTSNPSSSK